MPKKEKKPKCFPKLGIAIFMSLGIYFLVWGFMLQTVRSISWSAWNWGALLSYLIGIFLLLIAKMIKYKAYCQD